jgi:hypothetical protein
VKEFQTVRDGTDAWMTRCVGCREIGKCPTLSALAGWQWRHACPRSP